MFARIFFFFLAVYMPCGEVETQTVLRYRRMTLSGENSNSIWCIVFVFLYLCSQPNGREIFIIRYFWSIIFRNSVYNSLSHFFFSSLFVPMIKVNFDWLPKIIPAAKEKKKHTSQVVLHTANYSVSLFHWTPNYSMEILILRLLCVTIIYRWDKW